MSTISQMLQSMLFPLLQLNVGVNGIHRRINNMNVIEKEELTKFYISNEFVVTTCFKTSYLIYNRIISFIRKLIVL